MSAWSLTTRTLCWRSQWLSGQGCQRSQQLHRHCVGTDMSTQRTISDMRFSNFAIEYLRENEKVCETVFACLFVAQIESFKKTKKMLKISWHCPFKWCCKKIDFVKKFVQKIELPIMSNSKFIRGLWIFKIFWFSAVRTGLSKAEKCPRQHWVNLM